LAGTADFIKGLANNSQFAYRITAVIGCVFGVAIGQFDVFYIIDIALPVLMFIYPITIVLILLNALPKRWASKTIFRAVTLVTFVFSIPDFLQFFISESILTAINENIPLSQYSMGWVLPAFVVFVIANFLSPRKNYSEG